MGYISEKAWDVLRSDSSATKPPQHRDASHIFYTRATPSLLLQLGMWRTPCCTPPPTQTPASSCQHTDTHAHTGTHTQRHTLTALSNLNNARIVLRSAVWSRPSLVQTSRNHPTPADTLGQVSRQYNEAASCSWQVLDDDTWGLVSLQICRSLLTCPFYRDFSLFSCLWKSFWNVKDLDRNISSPRTKNPPNLPLIWKIGMPWVDWRVS